mmetsp:Transcript_128863/g.305738  ORF Transcript_128863/g.305738 Transcript_128863/m.305738 type:complete len:234 (-) Transcript_128863:161-862(-)
MRWSCLEWRRNCELSWQTFHFRQSSFGARRTLDHRQLSQRVLTSRGFGKPGWRLWVTRLWQRCGSGCPRPSPGPSASSCTGDLRATSLHKSDLLNWWRPCHGQDRWFNWSPFSMPSWKCCVWYRCQQPPPSRRPQERSSPKRWQQVWKLPTSRSSASVLESLAQRPCSARTLSERWSLPQAWESARWWTSCWRQAPSQPSKPLMQQSRRKQPGVWTLRETFSLRRSPTPRHRC